MAGLIGLLLWVLMGGTSAPPAQTPPPATAPAPVTATTTTPPASTATPATSPATTPAGTTGATSAAGPVTAPVAPPVATAAHVPQVTVGATPITTRLPAGFIGLSLEYSTPPQWSSSDGRTPSPVLVRLIRNLNPSGRPVIRIGGASAERTWWPVKGMSRPAGVDYALNGRWMRAVRTLAQATGAQLLLGINMAADQIAVVHAEAQAFLNDIGRSHIGALELGNEPEFFSHVAWYRRSGKLTLPWYGKRGTPVYARAASYGPGQWATQYAGLLRAIPSAPVAGPDTGNLDYLRTFERFVSPRSRVRMMTSHAYALTNCEPDATVASYPTVSHLLSIGASRGFAIKQMPYIEYAHDKGASFRVDELGSVSCNGKAGVSDTMASALWLTDALMSTAAAHADGVNLHTFPHESNNLFDLSRVGAQWYAAVHPLYYGALLFAQAAPTGSRLLQVQAPSQASLRPWATLGSDGALRVLLINDASTSTATHVSVPAAFATGAASVMRLSASSAYATSGLTLGGSSFGSQTTTGALPPVVPGSLSPSPGGGYSLSLPPYSATLLTIR